MDEKVPGFAGWLDTPAGKVARVSTTLVFSDSLGACLARWGIGRMSYMVPPGLYAIGDPTPDAPVLVTANYKMSFDLVRQSLAGRNVWLLVLETFGINVWCAAGKGTFGTDELVERISRTGLAKVVKHRNLILPILGAPGVAAHEVARRSGFNIRYATVRATDLPEYLDNGQVTTKAMGELTFNFYERLVLIPVEVVLALKSIIVAGVALYVIFAVGAGAAAGMTAMLAWIGAVLTGIIAGPLLLPWLPARSFAIKGVIVGLVWTLLLFLFAGGAWPVPVAVAAFLALPAVSAFYTMNFTGCTPYTSRSGVKWEMRLAIPAMGGAVLVSGLLLLVARLLNFG